VYGACKISTKKVQNVVLQIGYALEGNGEDKNQLIFVSVLNR
jgi:hypothetical protein